MKIFLAGAAGAIGKRLVPLLLDAGHRVVGTTRSPTKADALHAVGVEPVVVDVFDAPALSRAVSAARPDIVVHQLTDLPPGLDPARMAEGTRRNARMRREGTQNLVTAALAAGVPGHAKHRVDVRARAGAARRRRSARCARARYPRGDGRRRRHARAADPRLTADRRRCPPLWTSLRTGHRRRR